MNNWPITYSSLGFGALITDNTVIKMQQIIRESAKNIDVRNTAANIISACAPKDYFCEANSIYNWVKDNSRYTRDIEGTELIFSPLVALDEIANGNIFFGDCDDLTVLALSLLKSVGFRTALRTASYIPSRQFHHVYGLVMIKGVWTPIEMIKKEAPIGWEAPSATAIKDYEI